jgi:hypothetical protein
MKKLLLLMVCVFFTHSTFAQQKNRAMHIIFQNVDTTYFDEEGFRWHEFSMPLHRAFKVNDLLESDTSLKECDVIKGHKAYLKYMKVNYPEIKIGKLDKGVFGYLDCTCDDYLILMWMRNDYAKGLMARQTLN